MIFRGGTHDEAMKRRGFLGTLAALIAAPKASLNAAPAKPDIRWSEDCEWLNTIGDATTVTLPPVPPGTVLTVTNSHGPNGVVRIVQRSRETIRTGLPDVTWRRVHQVMTQENDILRDIPFIES